MKRIKFNVGLLAMILGLAAALAFKPAASKAHRAFATSWFTYNGSGSVTDPANYTEVTGTPDCPGTTNMCAIQATVNSNQQPVITQSLQNEINTDLANHQPSANVSLRD